MRALTCAVGIFKSSEALLALCVLALAPIRKQYRKGLLFIDKKSDFGAISVTVRSCAATIMNVDGHISDGFLPASSQCEKV